MQQVQEPLPTPAEVLKTLLATPIGNSLVYYIALNEDNYEYPGHHPFLDRGFLAEVKRLIESQLTVLYNVLDNSMDAIQQARKYLSKYLSLFVSLIEAIDHMWLPSWMREGTSLTSCL
ncbi:MAG: hypothetical protein U5O16_00180 [Rhodococcus sp. (in: high G+C Gram-positive bacteria)]|uniref:hypothetical protein n=1 Tax=Rhodococcus sp. TaxID=1831 RepID=UPI002AD705EA|nr:hypothetical protein [Rhodococcus sp. (in: high G+C Gram-positive bacteria)]